MNQKLLSSIRVWWKDRPMNVHGYQVEIDRRPFQRSINVTVKPNGWLKVTAGKSTPINRIQEFLSECDDWLKKVITEYNQLRQKYPPKLYLQGESFLYLGQMRALNYYSSYRSRLGIDVKGPFLHVGVPKADWNEGYLILPQPKLKPELLKFYQRKGREILSSRLQIFSEKMGLYPSAVSFRSQKTRWGSCSSLGRISLNWRLIAAPIETLDYVVIHELAHLRHQNHSERFWSLVSRFSNDYQTHRQWLRRYQYEFDFLAKSSELHPE